MKLTTKNVGTLGPGDHAYKNGLVLRVRSSGARSWALRYSFRGQDRRLTIDKVKVKDTDKGLTLKQAHDAALDVLARIARGEDPQALKMAEKRAGPPPAELTIAQLGTEAMANLRLRPKSRTEYERLFQVEIVPTFGQTPAMSLSRRAIREWGEAIAKRAPYVANRAFALLRRFYSLGIERDLISASPFVGLKQPASEQASERVLSSAELWALLRSLESLPTTGSAVVKLLLLTGVRLAMVLGAKASEFEGLDGHDPRWVIPGGFEGRSKSGRAHVVPLSKPALELVRSRLKGEYLFPAGKQHPGGPKAKSPTKTWRSAYVTFLEKRVNALLDKPASRWTIHNLRHTIASHMREDLGVRADVVSLVLGHTVSEGATVTRIYDRAKLLKERRAALVAWAEWLERLPDPRKKLLKWKEA